MSDWTVYAPLLGVAGLIIAGLVYNYINSHSAGNDRMQEIADAIHEGAMVFLQAEYKILAGFIAIVFVLLFTMLWLWFAIVVSGISRTRFFRNCQLSTMSMLFVMVPTVFIM